MFGKELSTVGFKYMGIEKGRRKQKNQEVMACRRI